VGSGDGPPSKPGPGSARPAILLRGARQNNLKGFDLEIPHGALTVITGVSGSGKSSLAFQTLYAEGQRRYAESFSAYVRQFLERLPRPKADSIEGMLPAVAIEQPSGSGGGRSTVATMTDLGDYLKLLFARAGVLHCPTCGEAVPEASAVGLRDRILGAHAGQRVTVAFPRTLALGEDGEAEAERYRQLAELRKSGFTRRLRIPGWDGTPGALPSPPEVVELDASALEEADAALAEVKAAMRAASSKAARSIGKDARSSLKRAARSAKGSAARSASGAAARSASGAAARSVRGPGDGADGSLETSARTAAARIFLAVDRLALDAAKGKRLLEAVELALAHGDGPLALLVEDGPGRHVGHRHSLGLVCQSCGRSFEPPTTNLFSYNTPVGACEACGGFGRVMAIDWDLVIPDPRLSLSGGAIKPWTTPKTAAERTHLRSLCASYGIPMHVPWKDLSEKARRLIVEGDEDEGAWGLRGWFDWLESRTYRTHVRILLSRYRAFRTCPSCGGARLKPEALAYRVGGRTLGDIYRMDVVEARRFFQGLGLPEDRRRALDPVLGEIRSRLAYLEEVGVEYLTLDRPARTLSGGEAQRVTLTTALGASLVQTLFVLDEPTVGLHPRDTDRLVGTMRRLTGNGNTLVVVEHDADVIQAADHLVDLGPGAGEAGGELLFAGSPRDLLAPGAAPANSLTAALIGRPGRILDAAPPRRSAPRGKALRLRGATAHNLADLDLDIPLGALVCVTGVSGSGKSTLVEHVIYRGLSRRLGKPMEPPGAHRSLEGWEGLEDVIYVDQSPAASSPRATPLTYVGVLDRIRQLFASTEEARLRGFGPGTFSFNTPGGRCEACEGTGVLRVELHFLPDAQVTCEVCEGRRYTGEALAATWRGLSIHDLFGLTVNEALRVFQDEPRVARGLVALAEVGLGYLRLGQGLNTLSGGEAQRLKIARHLTLEKTSGCLFILDEPTRGLHLADVAVLVKALHGLVGRGNTVLVVEHHPEVIWQADHVIDLGPEGGALGGRLVAAGPPELICAAPGSHTGRFLAAYLAGEPGPVRAATARKDEVAPSLAAEAGGMASRAGQILLRGAREHNLKDLDLAIPRDRLVVLTGPSGSGKSSVAFDILHAEGQRRFLDCLSPYARQYMQQLSRPELSSLQGLPPTIAVEQRLTRGRRHSTVATVTEIYPYLRLLFAKAGRQRCLSCGALTSSATPEELLEEILARHSGQRVRLLAPVLRRRKGWHDTVFARARRMGLAEVRVDGALRPLAGRSAPQKLARYRLHDVDFVLLHGQVEPGALAREKWRAVLGQALDLGRGRFSLLPDETLAREGAQADHLYGTSRTCRACRLSYEPPDPRLFSFTGAEGACPACSGAGRTEDGELCSACSGARLKPQALAVELGGLNLAAVSALRPGEAQRFLSGLDLGGALAEVVDPLRQELMTRLGFLITVGLDYLGLDRAADTLSGGELQRLRLAAHLSAPLHGVLYILDEPTIGLHPEDQARLLSVLGGLRRAENTVLIVEHDEETMRAADHLIDLGPGGGREGGRLVDQGSPAAVERLGTGLTARLLRGEVGQARTTARATSGARGPRGWITIEGASAHNLRDLDLRLPTGALTVITGRSGSGKSTLLEAVLLASARAGAPVGCEAASGLDSFARVVEVDQQPIGRNPRSCPATYIGLMGRLRERFAALPEARLRGFGPGRFSFNVEGGRCPHCEGHGWLTVEMGFLPDAQVPCPRCEGRRYHRDTLEIRMLGRSIAEVLELTAGEAAALLGQDRRLARPLELLVEIGLDYLPLGQPSTTLSGGEAQRIKLVDELSKTARGASLYLLDGPTTGLHGADVEKLVAVLGRLVDRGDTVVLIEHHLGVIASADWILDLGPGAGPDGGRSLYQGPPQELAARAASLPESATAAWLARHLARARSR
jgi:excinuclease ABC subunit A